MKERCENCPDYDFVYSKLSSAERTARLYRRALVYVCGADMNLIKDAIDYAETHNMNADYTFRKRGDA